MIQDQIVFGLSEARTRERLLREPDVVDLVRAVKICQSAAEAAQRHVKALEGSEPAKVAYVASSANSKKSGLIKSSQHKDKPKGRSGGTKRFIKRKSSSRTCVRCGN